VKAPLPLLAVSLALLVAGCGGEAVIDQEAAAEDIRVGFATRHITVSDVDCPGGVKTDAGSTYACVADTSRGRFRVIYRQLDADGSVSQPRIERLKGDAASP
jgi:hypothetical protein